MNIVRVNDLIVLSHSHWTMGSTGCEKSLWLSFFYKHHAPEPRDFLGI